MVGFQHKLIGQRIKINFIKAVPDAQQRNQILFADLFLDPVAHQIFVRETCFKGCGIVQLEPLKLFIKGFGVFQIQILTGGALEPSAQLGGVLAGGKIVVIIVVFLNKYCLNGCTDRRGRRDGGRSRFFLHVQMEQHSLPCIAGAMLLIAAEKAAHHAGDPCDEATDAVGGGSTDVTDFLLSLFGMVVRLRDALCRRSRCSSDAKRFLISDAKPALHLRISL